MEGRIKKGSFVYNDYVIYCTMYEYDLSDVINDCSSVEVYRGGVKELLSPDKADKVKRLIISMNDGGYEMPGYGVSIDSLTREEMKNGVWVRLVYPERTYRGEIPFESLLIKVERDYCGYNLIREYDGKYQGRVFYYNLKEGTTMQVLHELLCG